MHIPSSAVCWWFQSMDRARRIRGATMDQMGYGPIESPYQTRLTQPGMRLRFYGGAASSQQIALIIPAPIKRHYIWDMAPECSVVQRALAAGMQVYLIEWTTPETAQAEFGLADYGYRLIDECVNMILSTTPHGRIFLLSHSLGGVLAASYAALRPERVSGMVMIESPMHFAEANGSFAPLAAFGPPAHSIVEVFDNVPGSVLSMTSVAASPATFLAERYADFVASLESDDLIRRHLQVQRWTLDEAPMSGRLFEEVAELLYREDRFMRGSLVVNGRSLGPADIVAPFLAVYDPRSLIIPPASITLFQAATASSNKRLLPYHGDKGVALAHVGALVGDNAHRQIWPEIFRWINEVCADEAVATRH
ncbi:alpha/beta fold hydrolase [Noviherbaspirillum sp. ST 5-3]|uniref:alpha/beta fold hydrolase n=1 Tax=Noviherbaspirillum sp. ST 5-3 TaxID=3349878 RepID=UPI0039170DB1